MQSYSLVSYFMSYGFLMAYYLLFISLRYTKARSVMICAVSASCACFLEYLLVYVAAGNSYFYVGATLAQIILTQATAMIISRTRDSKVLFTGLSGSNYIMAGGIIGAITNIYTQSTFLAVAANVMTHLLLLLLLVVRIRNIYLSFYEKPEMKKWWTLCLIPSLFYCCFCFLAVFPNSLHENPQNILGIVMLLVTMFVSYIVVFGYVENEINRSGLYWENELFESYIHGLESQYEAVEHTEYNLRILRHDMRHYMGMIHSLLEQKEYDEIRKITGHISEVIMDNQIKNYCQNRKVNSIVSNLMNKADDMEVAVSMDMDIPDRIPVNDLELASVIANLLENALDSANELEGNTGSVNILVRCSNEHLVIETENKCAREVVMNPVTRLPISRKGRGHGIGLQSVQAFAKKLDANFDCYYENGTFTVRLFANF